MNSIRRRLVARGLAAVVLVSCCLSAAVPALARSSEGDRRIPRPRPRVLADAPAPIPLAPARERS